MVIPNNSKINLPRMTKMATIINAIKTARLLIRNLASLLAPPTNDKNIGKLEIGFIMAKNPVNTVIEKVKR